MDVLPLRVRRAREDAGLTLADVADGRMSRTAIHLIEMGRSRPSEATLAHIASRTGKPIAYFMGAESPSTPVSLPDMVQRVVEPLRRSSWALSALLRSQDLREPERVALEGLLVSLRQGMRLVQVVSGETDES